MRVVEGNGKRGLGSVCCPNRMRARTCSLILSNLLHKFIYQQPCFPSSLSSRISDLQLSLVSGNLSFPSSFFLDLQSRSLYLLVNSFIFIFI